MQTVKVNDLAPLAIPNGWNLTLDTMTLFFFIFKGNDTVVGETSAHSHGMIVGLPTHKFDRIRKAKKGSLLKLTFPGQLLCSISDQRFIICCLFRGHIIACLARLGVTVCT